MQGIGSVSKLSITSLPRLLFVHLWHSWTVTFAEVSEAVTIWLTDVNLVDATQEISTDYLLWHFNITFCDGHVSTSPVAEEKTHQMYWHLQLAAAQGHIEAGTCTEVCLSLSTFRFLFQGLAYLSLSISFFFSLAASGDRHVVIWLRDAFHDSLLTQWHRTGLSHSPSASPPAAAAGGDICHLIFPSHVLRKQRSCRVSSRRVWTFWGRYWECLAWLYHKSFHCNAGLVFLCLSLYF